MGVLRSSPPSQCGARRTKRSSRTSSLFFLRRQRQRVRSILQSPRPSRSSRPPITQAQHCGGRSHPVGDPPLRDRAQGLGRRLGAVGRGLHPVLLRRGGQEISCEPGAGAPWEDLGVQVLCGAGRGSQGERGSRDTLSSRGSAVVPRDRPGRADSAASHSLVRSSSQTTRRNVSSNSAFAR